MPDFDTYSRTQLESEVANQSMPGFSVIAQAELDYGEILKNYATHLRDCANDIDARVEAGGRRGFDRPNEPPPNP